MKICGIDPSIASSGRCIMELNDSDLSIKSVMFSGYHDQLNQVFGDARLKVICVGTSYSKRPHLERQHIVNNYVMEGMTDVKYVAFEGYAYSKAKTGPNKSQNSRGIFQLAEMVGSIKRSCYEAGIGVMIYPPTSLKKFATNDGNADKIKMWKYFKELYPTFYHPYLENIIDWENPCSDLVDAFWLCEALRNHLIYEILGKDRLPADRIYGLEWHTPASDPLIENKLISLSEFDPNWKKPKLTEAEIAKKEQRKAKKVKKKKKLEAKSLLFFTPS